MNASLLNPFAHDTPDSVEATLERASASCIRFNHGKGLFAGHYLGAGRTDGFVTVWDIETKGLLRWLEGHVKPVTALAWSPYGRYLASASLDSNLIVWDLACGHGLRHRTVRFDAPVVGVHFSPISSKILLAVLDSQQVFLVDLRARVKVRKGGRRGAAVNGITPHAGPIRTELTLPSDDDEEGSSAPAPAPAPPSQITATRFSPDGQRIFAGTAKGAILVFDVRTCKLIAQFRTFGSSTIRELAFDRAGRTLVINCNDRTIRILAVDMRAEGGGVHIMPLHRFQDLVNRTPWNGIGFSGDGDYVFGGAAHKVAHNIYIWDRGAGALDKILEGPREPLIDVDWHPTRPLLASVSTSGNISLWFTPVSEIWSAYAPGFEELEENLIYEEREDEFDLEDEEELKRRKQDEEEALVDIWSLGPEGAAGRVGVGGGDDAPPRAARRTPDAPPEAHVKLEDDGHTPHALHDDGLADADADADEEYEWVYEPDDDCSRAFVLPVRLEDEVHELGADSDSDSDRGR